VLDFFKKTPGLVRMGLLLVLGVALLLFASSGSKKTEEKGEQNDLSAYGEALEKRLESLCAQVEGVGLAEVMVTFESGASTEYRGSTQIAMRPPKVQGVTVLCTGGRATDVRAALTEMLGALLDIGASRICVLPLSK
jgi:hypothetical protein